MQELLDRLTQQTGISPEQAEKVLETVKEFVKEKFPMMAGAVDNLLPTNKTNASSSDDPMD